MLFHCAVTIHKPTIMIGNFYLLLKLFSYHESISAIATHWHTFVMYVLLCSCDPAVGSVVNHQYQLKLSSSKDKIARILRKHSIYCTETFSIKSVTYASVISAKQAPFYGLFCTYTEADIAIIIFNENYS